MEILSPKNQLKLFGYKNYFDEFIKLYKKKVLPNSILLSGNKGLGKFTFAFHFINFILSRNEENAYSSSDFKISENNLSYKLINKKIHPNFFLINNSLLDKEIKIDQIRSLHSFLGKSTYTKNLKIVLINNAENLNLNSSNALLKSLEEPTQNTFFFLIHNNDEKILDTIKSRCVEFRLFFF